jgi:hypothetical protein
MEFGAFHNDYLVVVLRAVLRVGHQKLPFPKHPNYIVCQLYEFGQVLVFVLQGSDVPSYCFDTSLVNKEWGFSLGELFHESRKRVLFESEFRRDKKPRFLVEKCLTRPAVKSE